VFLTNEQVASLHTYHQSIFRVVVIIKANTASTFVWDL